jgi:hypothetical protein
MMGQVTAPSEGVRSPSAMVGGLEMVCISPVRKVRVASSASSGSTPITAQSETEPAASAVPESSPPPPHGARISSSPRTSEISSSAAVPCPATMSGWSYGGMIGMPRSSASRRAISSRDSPAGS